MKLTVRRGGGISGIVTRTELDTAALPDPVAEDLVGEVQRAGLQDQPGPEHSVPATEGQHEPRAPAVRQPDSQLYEISVEGLGAAPFSARYTDESLPEQVRHLMELIDARPERTDSVEM
ncbi:protealysin inhibitor emfourin [Sinomonas atrocyanea]|uniref:protealysin inhibitor emfourin n=1 Tax=Sinomonas atrocyanea TaxID=37927 RepID=UPI003D9837C0